MVSLGKRIEKALPKVQPRVEDMLEVSLGDIDVRPYNRVIKDILAKENPRFKALAYLLGYPIVLFIEANPLGIIAKAGSSSIYYNRNPLINLLSGDSEIEHITSHELAHIAHMRLIGESSYKKSPRSLKEGLAEYVARKLAPLDDTLRAYERETAQFRQRLTGSVANIRNFPDFIRAQNPN